MLLCNSVLLGVGWGGCFQSAHPGGGGSGGEPKGGAPPAAPGPRGKAPRGSERRGGEAPPAGGGKRGRREANPAPGTGAGEAPGERRGEGRKGGDPKGRCLMCQLTCHHETTDLRLPCLQWCMLFSNSTFAHTFFLFSSAPLSFCLGPGGCGPGHKLEAAKLPPATVQCHLLRR